MDKILVTRSSMPELDEYVEEIRDIWDTHWLTNMGDKHKKRINAQNNLFFYRLNHSNTSINVGNPTTLSLNIFTSSWLSRAP